MSAVLVAGGAGYTDGHVVLAPRDVGLSMVVVDHLSTGRAEAVASDVPLIPAGTGDAEARRA